MCFYVCCKDLLYIFQILYRTRSKYRIDVKQWHNIQASISIMSVYACQYYICRMHCRKCHTCNWIEHLFQVEMLQPWFVPNKNFINVVPIFAKQMWLFQNLHSNAQKLSKSKFIYVRIRYLVFQFLWLRGQSDILQLFVIQHAFVALQRLQSVCVCVYGLVSSRQNRFQILQLFVSFPHFYPHYSLLYTFSLTFLIV